MNLVLSGPIDDSLRNLVVALSKPRRVVSLHERADRLEGAIDDVATRERIEALCHAARVDHAYIEEGVRFADFKLLAMDMDSTLITIECIDEIADYAGKKAEVAAITEAAMRGEMEFAESLRRRVMLLAGLNIQVLDQVWNDRLRLSPGATELVRQAKQASIFTMVVSGGFTYFSSKLVNLLSLDAGHANELECLSGVLTGRIKGPIFDAQSKVAAMNAVMLAVPCNPDEAIVIGDGANDIPMMQSVNYSVAYNAKIVVQREARLKVNYGTLKTILDYFSP